jgi:hypothetical protein
MQVRKLLGRMDMDSHQFKELLLRAVPMLVAENEGLKKQWRNQIVIYIAFDILMLLGFSTELQFIVTRGSSCLVPLVPLLLFMGNIFIHLFSFLFAIAILNQSFQDVESTAWRCSGFKRAPHLRTPAQVSALKDPEVCIILTGLSNSKIAFKIGPVQIDFALISTVTGVAASVFGLALPSFDGLGSNRACNATQLQ